MIALAPRAAFAACLLLAGCGESAPTPTAAPSTRPSAAPRQEALPSFPAPFQARWGLVPADCAPGRSDAKGLMTVGPDSLNFYESRAKIAALRQTAPGVLEAALSFSGEGMTWTKRETLSLSADGQALERRTSDEAGETRLRYARCPA